MDGGGGGFDVECLTWWYFCWVVSGENGGCFVWVDG